jgi:hypothetical protein
MSGRDLAAQPARSTLRRYSEPTIEFEASDGEFHRVPRLPLVMNRAVANQQPRQLLVVEPAGRPGSCP